MRNDFEALLGLQPVGDNGLPQDRSSAFSVLESQSDPRYRDNFGTWTYGEAYNPYTQNGVLYRADGWQDIVNDEYQSQKGWTRAAHGIGRLMGTTLTKAGQGIGYLGALTYEIGRGLFDGVDTESNAVSRAADNGFSQIFESMEESVKETMPIFKPSGYENRTVAQKLFSSGLSFYLDEAVDGLAFAMSNYIPGGGLKLLGSGAKLGKMYAASMQGTKVGGKLAKTATERAIKNMDLFTTGVTMTAMEAMFEAKEVKDAVLRELSANGGKYTKEEREAIASQRAADAFALNMAFLAPSNALELGAVFGNIFRKGATKASRNVKGISRVTNEAGEKVAKAQSNWMNHPITRITANAAAEGLWEENIQYTISSMSSYINPNESKNDLLNAGIGDAFSKVLRNFNTLMDLSDQKRLESVALGSMIGAGMAGGTSLPGVSTLNERMGGDGGAFRAYKRDKDRAAELADWNNSTSIKDATSFDGFKRKPSKSIKLYKEDGKSWINDGLKVQEINDDTFKQLAEKYELDAEKGGEKEILGDLILKNGAPQWDEVKVKQAVLDTKHREALLDLEDALSQYPEKNKIARQLVRKNMLAKSAMDHFKDGLGQFYFDKLEALKNASEEELIALGLDPNNKEADIEEAIQYATQLEDLYNAVSEATVADTSSVEDMLMQKMRTGFMLDRGQMIMAIDAAARTNREDINATLQSIDWSDEDQETVNELMSLSNRLMSARLKFYNDNSDTAFTKELNKFNNKLDALMQKAALNAESTTTNAVLGELERKQFIQEQLDQSRKNLKSDYDKVSDPRAESWKSYIPIPGVKFKTKGFQYFKNNYQELFDKYSDVRMEGLTLTDTTTLKTYKQYEKEQLNKLKLKVKLDYLTAKNVSNAWRLQVSEGAHPVSVISAILKEGGLISQEDRAELDNYISSYIDELTDYANEYATALQNLDNLLHNPEATEEEIQEARNSVQEWKDYVISYQQIAEENSDAVDVMMIPNLAKAYQDAIERSDRIFNRLTATEEDVKFTLADSFTTQGKLAIKRVEENEEYDDVPAVEKAITQVKNLVRLFEERDDLDQPRKERYVTELKSLIAELEEVLNEVKKRKANRKLKETKILRNRVKHTLKFLGITFEEDGSIYFGTSPVYDKIKAIVGDEFIIAWEAAISKDIQDQVADEEVAIPVPNEAYLYTLMHQLGDQYQSTIQETVDGAYSDLLFFIDRSKMSTKAKDAVKDKLPGIKTNSINVISYLFRFLGTNRYQENGETKLAFDSYPESVIYQYMKDLDLFKALSDIENEVGRDEANAKGGSRLTKQEVEEVLNILSTFYISEQLSLMSEIDMQNLLKRERSKAVEAKQGFDAGNKADFVPSITQRITLYQTIRSIFKADPSVPMSNVTIIKGPAGAGKSLVVGKWIPKIMNLDSSNVLTAGHNVHSAANIANSVDTGYPPLTAKELLKQLEEGAIDENVNLVIIDEAPAIIEGDLVKLYRAIGEYSKDNPEVHFVLMGDPNQIVNTNVVSKTTPPLDQVFDSSFPNLVNVAVVPPLTVRYRTDNPAILDVQDAFMDNVEAVTGLRGVTNVNPEDITTENLRAIGSYVERSNANLLTILYNQIRNAPSEGMTRAVIVGTEEAAQKYKDAISTAIGEEALTTKVEVLTVIQAQGRTFGEVYVDLSDLSHADSFKFNQFMYTATSRASDFLYVANIENVENFKDPSIGDIVESNKAQVADLYDSHMQQVNSELEVYTNLEELLKPKAEPNTKEETEEEEREEQAEEEEIANKNKNSKQNTPEDSQEESQEDTEKSQEDIEEDTEDYVETNEEKKSTEQEETEKRKAQRQEILNNGLEEDFFRILEPSQNSFFFSEEDDVAYEGLRDKLEEGFVSAKLIKMADEITGDYKYAIVIPLEKGQVEVVGALTKGEAKKLGIPSKLKGEVFGDYLGGNRYSVSGISSFLDVQIHPLSSKMNWDYEGSREEVVFDTLITRLTDSINRVEDERFIDDNHDVTYENIEQAIHDATVLVFTSKMLKNYKGNMDPTKMEGRPFLEVKGLEKVVRVKNEKGEWVEQSRSIMKPMYIELDPRNLDITKDTELLEPINEFIATVEELEKVLDNATAGRGIKLGQAMFTEIVTEFSNKWAIENGYKAAPVEGDKINKSLQEQIEQVYNSVVNALGEVPAKQMVSLAVAIDELVHGKWTERAVTKHGNPIRRYQGPAQQAFDTVARGNTYFKDKDGVIITLKSERRGRGGKTNLTGRSLLEPKGKAAPEYTLSRLAQRYTRLAEVDANEDYDTSYLKKKRIYKKRGDKVSSVNRMSLDLAELKYLFQESAEDSTLTKLKVTINKADWNYKKIAPTQNNTRKLAKKSVRDTFTTTFQGVIPTSMYVKIDGVAAKGNAETKQETAERTANASKQEEPETGSGARKRLLNLAKKIKKNNSGEDKFSLNVSQELGREIDKTFADELFRMMNPGAARTRFLRTLKNAIIRFFTGRAPRTQDETDFYRILDEHHMARMGGDETISFYQKGLLSLMGNKSGGTYERALFHEQWHRFSQGILGDEARIEMYLAMLNNYPNLQYLSALEIEEFLAERFADYAVDKIQAGGYTLGNKVRRQFARMLRLFNLVSDNFDNINDVFEKVMIGYYGGVYQDSNSAFDKLNINTKFTRKYFSGKDSEDRYNIALNFVVRAVHKYSDRHARAQYLDKMTSREVVEEDLVSYTSDEAVKMALAELQSLDKNGYYIDPDLGIKIYEFSDLRDAENTIEEINAILNSEVASELTEEDLKLASETKANAEAKARKQRFKKAAIKGAANPKLFAHFISQIYPVDGFSFDLEELYQRKNIHQEYDFEDELFDSDEVLSLEAEIESKEDISLKKNTTTQIKMVLSRIYEDSETRKLVRFEKAMAVAVDAMRDIPVGSSDVEVLKMLKAQRGKFKGDKGSRAVLSYLERQYKLAAAELNENIQHYNDGIVVVRLAPSKRKLRHVPMEEALAKPDTYRVFFKQENENQPEFLKRVESSLGGFRELDIKKISYAYELFKAKELTADIAKTIQSLEEKNYLVGIKNWEFDREQQKSILRKKFIRGSENYNTGAYFNTASINIANTFRREARAVKDNLEKGKTFYKNKVKIKSPFNFLDLEAHKGAKNVAARNSIEYAALVEFFDYLRLPRYFKDNLPGFPASEQSHSLFKLFNEKVTYFNDEVAKQNNSFNPNAVASDERGLASELGNLAAINDEKKRATTYISGDGKRKWRSKRSSFWGVVMRTFRTDNWAMEDYLNDPYFSKYNIFLNGLSKIHDFEDFDSIKWQDNEASAKLYKNESPEDWLERNMDFGFVESVNTSGEEATYWQQVYTTSNKPTMRMVKVNLLDAGQIKKAIRFLRAQENNRPSGPAWDALAYYTPGTKYFNLSKQSMRSGAESIINYYLDRGLFFPNSILNTYQKVVGKEVPQELRDLLDGMSNKEEFKKLKEKYEVAEGEELTAEQKRAYREESKKLMQDYRSKLGDMLIPYMEIVYANFYINSYALNNLVAGDMAVYKTGKETEDLIKRLSIIAGPGDQMRIGEDYMKEHTNVAIVKDLEAVVGDQFVLGSPEEEQTGSYDLTDAQGFITPAYAHRIKLGLGRNSAPDVVLKPVYYGFDTNGVPRAIKLSVVVLTDELVKKFPGLGTLRDKMEDVENPTDMMVFASAVKIGNIKKDLMGKIEEKQDETGKYYTSIEFPETSKFTVPSKHMRIQLDPAKDVIAKVANPSQIAYLGMANPEIRDLVQDLWGITTDIMAAGSESIDEQLALAWGKSTEETKQRWRDKVVSVLENMEGSEREYILATIPDVSWDIPMLTTKAIRTLGSTISKETSQFKLRGGKLVLQSEAMTDIRVDGTKEPLQWRDKDGYTEVYVSDKLLKQLGLKVGDTVDPKVLGIVAYRIPSTGLHSALVLKIKDTYPAPFWSKGNVIIAPHRIVHVHGSDYDVDSLQYITRYRVQDVLDPSEYDIYKYLSVLVKDSKIEDLKPLQPMQQINYLPLNGKALEVDPVINREYLKSVYSRGQELLRATKEQEGKKEIRAALKVVRKLMLASAKNDMVDKYIDMITHKSSRKWIELPITMEMLSGKKVSNNLEPSTLDLVAMMRGWDPQAQPKSRDEILYPNMDPADIMNQLMIHFNTFSGNSLTGAGANAVKVLAYIMASSPTLKDANGRVIKQDPVRVKEDLHISWNGGVYDHLRHKETKVVNGELVDNEVTVAEREDGTKITKTYYIWETLDSLINAAIDNVKEQILFNINLNKHTSNAFFFAAGLGIPINEITKLMTQPVLLELALTRGTLTNKHIETKIGEVQELLNSRESYDSKNLSKLAENIGVNSEAMVFASQEYWSKDKKLDGLSNESLEQQLQVLRTFKKLFEGGEALYTSSQASVILRQIPTEYAMTKRLVESMYEEISNAGLTTDDLVKMETEKQEQYSSILARISMRFNAAESWPFENSHLLNVPHFKEAFTNALKFLNVVEQNTFVNSPSVNGLALDIVQNQFKMKVFGKDSVYSKANLLKTDFLSFINASLNFTKNLGSKFNMSLDNVKPIQVEGGQMVTGFDAFTHRLGQDIINLKIKFPDNPFLQSLVVKPHWKTKVYTINFYGHNTSSTSIINSYKAGFRNLNTPEVRQYELTNEQYSREFKYKKDSEPEFSDIQMRLLKNLLISKGLVFSASSYMELMTDEMIQMYSKTFDAKVSEIQRAQIDPLNNSVINDVKDLFTLQFASNRGSLLEKINQNDISFFEEDRGDSKVQVAHGQAATPDGVVKFDLMVKGDKPNFVRVATDTTRGTFVKIATYETPEGKLMSLYRRIGSTKADGGYTNLKAFNGLKYDITRVIVPESSIVNDAGLSEGGKFSGARRERKFEEGEIVFMKSNKDVGLENMKKYRIQKYLEYNASEDRHKYQLTYVGEVDPYVKNTDTVEVASNSSKVTSESLIETLKRVNSKESARKRNNLADELELTESQRLAIENNEMVEVPLMDILTSFMQNPFISQQVIDDLMRILQDIPDAKVLLVKALNSLEEDGVTTHTGLSGGVGVIAMSMTQTINDFTRVLHHEAAHELTLRLVSEYEAGTLDESAIGYEEIRELELIYERLKDQNDPSLNSEYGMKSLAEFVAEARSNTVFRNKLQNKGALKSILDYIYKLFLKIFNREVSEDTRILYQVDSLIDSIIDMNEHYKPNKPLVASMIGAIRNSYIVGTDIDSPIGTLADQFKLYSRTEQKDTERKSTIDALQKLAVDTKLELMGEGTPDSYYYNDTAGKLERLTEYLRDRVAKFSDNNKTYAEWRAEQDYKSKGIAKEEFYTVNDNGITKEYTFQDRVNYHSLKSNSFRAYGNYAHLLIEKFLSKNSARITEIDEQLYKLQQDVYENGILVQEGIKAKTFKWLNDRMGEILNKSGITYDTESEEFNEKFGDKVAPEILIALDALKVGSKADGLIEHPNGVLSLIDWKTQNLLSDRGRRSAMKYGKRHGIMNDKLSKAKLEVALRALMIKANMPDAKFNTISVNWLHRRSGVRIFHVNMEAYLGILADMLKDTDIDTYNKLNEQNLFDAKTYMADAVLSTRTAKYDLGEDATAEQQLEYLQARLDGIRLRLADGDVLESAALREEEKQIIKDIALLELGSNYEGKVADEDDMDRTKRQLYNLKDPKHKMARLFGDKLLKAMNMARSRKTGYYERHDELLAEVLGEYYERKGKSYIAKRIRKGEVTFLNKLMGTSNAREIFDFMWKEHTSEAKTGFYANLGNTYMPYEGTVEKQLSEAQKAYRDYYHESMRSMYQQLYNKKVIFEGRTTTVGKLQNLPDMYEDFMPRSRPTYADIRHANPGLTNLPKVITEWGVMAATSYTVDNYQNSEVMGVPLRYMPEINAQSIMNQHHSFDVSQNYKQFMSNLTFKYDVDSAYTLGKALNQYLKDGLSDEKGKAKFPVLASWIEDMMKLHVFNDVDQTDFHFRESKIPVPDRLKSIYGDSLRFNAFGIAKLLKTMTSLAGMAFKIASGTFNGALIIFTNHLKGATNSVSIRTGTDRSEVAFTFSDVFKANAVWVNYIWDWMRGKGRANKMWNISRKMEFLPENYDYAVSNKDSLLIKQGLFNMSSAYYFHSMFESYGAHMVMTTMLQNRKYKWYKEDADGKIIERKESSLWDMMDAKGNIAKGWHRGYLKQKDGTVKKWREVTSEEREYMRRAYERLHGSYSSEERLIGELTVIGQWALQFKKYLPTLIKENWRRRQVSPFVGMYKQVDMPELRLSEDGTVIKPDDVNVYEWEEMLTQGRMSVMSFHLLETLRMRKILPKSLRGDADVSYLWNSLSGDQKASVVNAWSTLLMLLVLPLALFGAADDDDENTYMFKRTLRLVEDLSLGFKPQDLIRPIATNPVPVLDKALLFLDELGVLTIDGLWRGETDSKGLPKGVYNMFSNMPLGSAYHQATTYLDEMLDAEVGALER